MRSTITEPGVAVKDQSIIIVRKRHASGVYRRMLALYKKTTRNPGDLAMSNIPDPMYVQYVKPDKKQYVGFHSPHTVSQTDHAFVSNTYAGIVSSYLGFRAHQLNKAICMQGLTETL